MKKMEKKIEMLKDFIKDVKKANMEILEEENDDIKDMAAAAVHMCNVILDYIEFLDSVDDIFKFLDE